MPKCRPIDHHRYRECRDDFQLCICIQLIFASSAPTAIMSETRTPPIYEELAFSSTQGSRGTGNSMSETRTPPIYDEIAFPSTQGSSSNSNLPDVANADMLLRIDAGVQMFFITPEGVTAPSYSSCLSIYRFRPTAHPNQAALATSCETVPAFLQVGDWIYPLLPGESPVLQSDMKYYIFPDVSSSDLGNTRFFRHHQ